MANANTPRGIIPYAYMSGAPYNGAVRTYAVPSNNATALYIGDPVNLIANSSDGNGIGNVVIATAGSTHQILGSFMGIANNAGQKTITLLQSQTPYLAASQAAYVMVSDDPFLLYWAQEDSDGGAMVSGAPGGNINLVAGTGSTFTNYSGWQLDSSTLSQAGTDSTLQMRVIEALQEVDNAIGTTGSPAIGIHAKWLVKINQALSAFTNPASGGT